MCELLGLCFNTPIRPNLSYKGFRRRSEENPDGWGIAFYPDKSVQIIKEPIEADESLLSEFIGNYSKIKSEIFISHVRLNSVSKPAFMNTHPFQRELHGKEYAFAHNGTLKNYEGEFDNTYYKPVGNTDSEAAFCHLMNNIMKKNIESWDYSQFKWLYNEIKYINSFGKFNCIFSDGDYLFCYLDMNGYKGLSYLHRKAPYSHMHLEDEHFHLHLKKQGETKKEGHIIATRPLTDEIWHSFNYGELRIFNRGKLVKILN